MVYGGPTDPLVYNTKVHLVNMKSTFSYLCALAQDTSLRTFVDKAVSRMKVAWYIDID